MRKVTVVVLLMSLCLLAEAQKASEWQIKTGTYIDVYTKPGYTGKQDDKSYLAFSLETYIPKWNVLLQANFDTRIVFLSGLPSWLPSFYKSKKWDYSLPTHTPAVGDTFSLNYDYLNGINALYRFRNTSNRHKLFAGIGLTGRREIVSIIEYYGGLDALTSEFRKIKIAPTLKVEYQFNVSKRFFLSSNLNYSYFFNTPHSYWQFGVNLGLKI
jgi:hypothetical protein